MSGTHEITVVENYLFLNFSFILFQLFLVDSNVTLCFLFGGRGDGGNS